MKKLSVILMIISLVGFRAAGAPLERLECGSDFESQQLFETACYRPASSPITAREQRVINELRRRAAPAWVILAWKHCLAIGLSPEYNEIGQIFNCYNY